MRQSKLTYYITCLISGMVELGTVFLGAKLGLPLVAILGLALAYQFGNILRFFVNKKIAEIQNIVVAVVFVLSLIIACAQKWYALSYLCLILYYILYSTFLQNIRSAVQGEIPRWKKRSCRVLGFVLSSLFFVLPIPLLIICAAILLYYSIILEKFDYEGWLKSWKEGKIGSRICLAMVTHQAHYFAYNYVVLYLVLSHFNNPYIAAACFAANWIPYTITEPLVQKLKWEKWFMIAVFAHVFNALVLLGMLLFFNFNIGISIGLWVLTGFGGGNVFCIKKALASTVIYDKNVWSFSEQIGHILGVITALILTVLSIPGEYTMVAAVVYALLTVPIIVRKSGKR